MRSGCSPFQTADFRPSRVESLLLQTMQQLSAGGDPPRRAVSVDSVPDAAVGLAEAAGERSAGIPPAGAPGGAALLVALQLGAASREWHRGHPGPNLLAVVLLLLASCASWLWCFLRFGRSEPEDKQQAAIAPGAPGSQLLPRAAAGGHRWPGPQPLLPEAAAGPGPPGLRPLPPPPPIGSRAGGLPGPRQIRDPFVDTRRGSNSVKGAYDVGSSTCVSGHYLRKTTAPLQPPVCSRPTPAASLPSRGSLLGTREVVR